MTGACVLFGMADFNKTRRACAYQTASMEFIDSERLSRAQLSIWHNARLLERLRFDALFSNGSRDAVAAALRAYQNSDGGFGHAIEPDFRGPISQPLGCDFALRALAEAETPDAGMLQDSLRYVRAITVDDGGVPNVLPSARAYPRAPWWQPASDTPAGSLLPTASLLGSFHRLGVQDPWMDSATAFTWRGIEQLIVRAQSASERIQRLFVAYESQSALAFLDHCPQRELAERAAAALGKALVAAKLISIEPDPAAEAAQPLEYAPQPDSLAARWLEPELWARHLDAWVLAQAEDGGWDVPWLIWTPVTQHEWRGVRTLERLKTLRAWGRFKLAA